MLERFMQVYIEELTKAVTEHPEEYGWPVEQVPLVADRMKAAFQRNSYNHDSRAIRTTCKRLGIKHTRKAITAFLSGQSETGAA